MEKTMKCLRCGQTLKFLRRENLQLGKTGLFTGDWGNLLAGALDVAILQCTGCGKLEFFKGDAFEEQDEGPAGDLAQVTCPNCGVRYDCDYPKCPVCGTENTIF